MARGSIWQPLSVGLAVGCLPSSSTPRASVWRRAGGSQFVIEGNLINHLQPARLQFPAMAIEAFTDYGGRRIEDRGSPERRSSILYPPSAIFSLPHPTVFLYPSSRPPALRNDLYENTRQENRHHRQAQIGHGCHRSKPAHRMVCPSRHRGDSGFGDGRDYRRKGKWA